MKKFMIGLLFALSSVTAVAGDGGYTVHACTSQSGRTQINIFQDHLSSSPQPYSIRLIIDGQMAEYLSESGQSPNIVYDWDNGTFAVFEKGALALSLVVRDNSVVIKKGFKDPRNGTEFSYYGNNENDIVTSCKRYEQGP